MKLELKRVSVNARLSEETACFSAVLYGDGDPIAEVSNHGTGGPDEFHPVMTARDRKLEGERRAKRYRRKSEEMDATLNALRDGADAWACDRFDWYDGGPYSEPISLIVSELLEGVAQHRKFGGRTTLYRIPGEQYEEDSWNVIKGPSREVNVAAIRKKYGEETEILSPITAIEVAFGNACGGVQEENENHGD